MDRYELPEGWEWKRLGDVVVNIQPGFACGEKSQTQGIPHLRMNNISSQGQLDLSLIWRVHADVIQQEKYSLVNGDVLFTNTNSPKLVGRSALFNLSGEYVFSNHLTRLRPKKDIHPRWLALVLHWLWLGGYFESICKQWVNQAAVSKTKLSRTEIPLPHLDEQLRIVARIDEITRRIKEARGVQQDIIDKADTLLPATLSQILSDDEKWNVHSVSEICEKPQYGYTESATAQAIGPKFLRITDIQNGSVNWSIVPYCKCEDIDKYRLLSGDILFARTGATTGKSYLVSNCPEAIFASYLIRLRVKSDLLPSYLWWYFQSPDYWAQVFCGVEVGAQPNMNGKKLASLKIPVPSLEEQHHIVAYLDSVWAMVEELKCQQQAVKAELDKIIPSVLSQAFRGEL